MNPTYISIPISRGISDIPHCIRCVEIYQISVSKFLPEQTTSNSRVSIEQPQAAGGFVYFSPKPTSARVLSTDTVFLFCVLCCCVMTKTNISTCERRDTVVCTFDKESPKILSFDIHEWIYERLRMNENENTTIQTDGLIRQVFIKFAQARELTALFDRTKGTAIYKLVTCGISRVTLCPPAWARGSPELLT